MNEFQKITDQIQQPFLPTFNEAIDKILGSYQTRKKIAKTISNYVFICFFKMVVLRLVLSTKYMEKLALASPNWQCNSVLMSLYPKQ